MVTVKVRALTRAMLERAATVARVNLNIVERSRLEWLNLKSWMRMSIHAHSAFFIYLSGARTLISYPTKHREARTTSPTIPKMPAKRP